MRVVEALLFPLLLLLSSGGAVAGRCRRRGGCGPPQEQEQEQESLPYSPLQRNRDYSPAPRTEGYSPVTRAEEYRYGPDYYSVRPTRGPSDYTFTPARAPEPYTSSDELGSTLDTTGPSRARARARARAPSVHEPSETSEARTVEPRGHSDTGRTRQRSRMRARLPRRRGGEVEEEAVAPRRAQLSRGRPVVTEAADLTREERETSRPARTRSRSRSRLRGSGSQGALAQATTEAARELPRLPRGRLRGRGQAREKKYTSSSLGRGQDYSGRRAQAQALAQPSKAQRPAQAPRTSPRIKFPKKNLFGDKVGASSAQRSNSIDTSYRAKAAKIDSSYRTKAAKLESSYRKSPNQESSSRTEGQAARGRSREEIQPSKPGRLRGVGREEEQPRLQSSHQEEREVPTAITVTHQVPVRTVFTVVEAGHTKSLFADTLETSLQIIAVSDLKSTEINSQRVVYAHAETRQPRFGVTELEFEAIQPTRTYREEERSLRVGGVETSVIESIPTTVYNVEKITARTTSTPSLDVGGIGLEALRDPGQLGALLQNVLLSILGGGLLGPSLQAAPTTQHITHTRSFLTTVTSLDTIQIPVNFRGSTIFQTVTEEKTQLVTSTDYSVQTVLNYKATTSTPFLPLAPTLHRAARVVPASPPPLNLPILHTSPPTLQTSLVTDTKLVTSTVTSLATSELLLTLGGREIVTEIVEPVTKVVTSTILSTQSVLVAESQPQPARTLRQLQLLQAILRLRA